MLKSKDADLLLFPILQHSKVFLRNVSDGRFFPSAATTFTTTSRVVVLSTVGAFWSATSVPVLVATTSALLALSVPAIPA